MSDGKKADQGKRPLFQGMFLYFRHALEAVAATSQYGQIKYDVPYRDENWSRVDNPDRYRDALLRHMAAELDAEYDPESGLLHAAHTAWNALAILERKLRDGAALRAPTTVVVQSADAPFKVGELVECIDPNGWDDILTKGATYKVEAISKNQVGTWFIYIETENGNLSSRLNVNRFTLPVPF